MHLSSIHNRMCCCAVILSLLLLAGCYESLHPISPPTAENVDERIFGTWHWKEAGSEAGFMHIGRSRQEDKQPGLLEIILIADVVDNGRRIGAVEAGKYTVHGSRVGSGRYLNIHSYDKKTGRVRYEFVKYVLVNDNELEYGTANATVLERHIREKTLKGEIRKAELGNDVLITASSEEIAKFIEKHDKELFTDFERVRRLVL